MKESMAIILREGLYCIRLLLRDISGLAFRSLLKNTLEKAINAEGVGNMHIRSGKLNGSTSFTIYNMHYVNFRIQV